MCDKAKAVLDIGAAFVAREGSDQDRVVELSNSVEPSSSALRLESLYSINEASPAREQSGLAALVELLALYWDTQRQANAISQSVARARAAHRPTEPAARPLVAQRRLDATGCQELATAYLQSALVTDLETRFGVHRGTVNRC